MDYQELRSVIGPPPTGKSYCRIYVASPLKAPSWNETYHNMLAARSYVDTVSRVCECRALALHGYLPMVLDDKDSQDRRLALEYGKMLLASCEAIMVCGKRISEGMKGEIALARELGLQVLFLEDFQ